MTEQEMRAAKVPWPNTAEELSAYIDTIMKQEHDYGTCVYAMSMAAEAAFNYVAHALGVTGFQAGAAGLDFLRRVRSMEGPFMISNIENALYPQYDLEGDLRNYLNEPSTRQWLRDAARKKLAETDMGAPAVRAHWEMLAK